MTLLIKFASSAFALGLVLGGSAVSANAATSNGTIACTDNGLGGRLQQANYPVHVFREASVRALVLRMRTPLHRKRLETHGIYLERAFSTLYGSGACVSYYVNIRFHLSESEIRDYITFGSTDFVRFDHLQGSLLMNPRITPKP